MFLLALAIAPALAIIIYILYRDVYNREPAINMVLSFLLGAFIIIPVVFIETLTAKRTDSSAISILLNAYLGVALVEELCKFLVLRYYSFTRRSFDEPLDGIVYSILISMGFATVENMFYIYQQGLSVAFLRMFTSVPAHATFGIFMGYFAGKAKFEHHRRITLLIYGLLAATIAHGTYDAFLLLGENAWIKTYVSDLLLFAGALASLYISIRLSRKLMRVHHLTSQQLFEAEPEPVIRKASDEDILLIKELSYQVWPYTHSSILTAEQINYMMHMMYSEAAIHQQLKDNHHFQIIYNAGIPIGYASYSEVEDNVYKLHKFYILPFQQRRGTGRFVIEKIIKELKDEGATALQLNVNRNNTAKEFYEKLGFEVIAEEDVDIGNGFFMNDYVMELKLDKENFLNDNNNDVAATQLPVA
jgi:RsiW-degrading membrane proteinase PrsW (M82 family)/ribosomal protein S18 acetylase RimI-like enzyme